MSSAPSVRRWWSVRPDAIAVATLGAVVCLVFWEALTTDRVFYERDIAGYWYPMIEVFVRTVSGGSPPFWNPSFTFGLPMLADPSHQVAYPPTWLNLVLLPATYYKLFVVGHVLVAASGLYALSRTIGASPVAAFMGAASWAFSGPLLSSVSVYHHFAAAAWLPWVLFALERMLRDTTARSAAVLGALAGAQLLAGSADVAFMTAVVAAGRVLAFLVSGPTGLRRRAVGLTWSTCLATLIATLLAALQWVPTFAVSPAGSRLRMSPYVNLYWSVHPMSLVDVVIPRFVEGLPLATVARAAIFEGREPFLASLYLGFPALALVVIGVLSTRTAPRGALGLGFLLFIALALGKHTPLSWILTHVPPFTVFRYPSKYMLAAAALGGVLVALGADVWNRSWTRRARVTALLASATLVLSSLGLLLSSYWLQPGARILSGLTEQDAAASALLPAVAAATRSGWLSLALGVLGAVRARYVGSAPWTRPALAALLVAAAVWAGRSVNDLAPAELLSSRPPVVAYVREDAPALGRVFVEPRSRAWLAEHFTRGPRGWEPEWRWTLGGNERLLPPRAARWDVGGSFDGDFSGLAPQPLSMLTVFMEQVPSAALKARLLRLGGVSHVVSVGDTQLTGVTQCARVASVYSEPINLYRVDAPLPRTYVVSGVSAAPEPASALLASDFDPTTTVVVPTGTLASRAAPSDFTGSVRTLRRDANAVSLEATASSDAVVVFLESMAPGWEAFVDEHAARVVAANSAFLGVPVPAGRHHVRVRYRPPGCEWGLGAFVLGCLLAASLLSLRSLHP